MVAARAFDRNAWLESRRHGLGGSDVAPILGLSRWRGPADVWLEKRGVAEQSEQSEPARWGELLEPVVLDEWARRSDIRVVRGVDHYPGGIVEGPEPWALASVDAVALDPDGAPTGVVEVKTSSLWRRREWGDDGGEMADGTVPDEYRLQVLHYLWCTRLDRGWIVALIGGQELRAFTVCWDPDYERIVVPRLRAFWRLVELGTPPAVDGSESADRMLRHTFGTASDESIVLPSETTSLLAEYRTAREETDAADKRADVARQRIQALMGPAAKAEVDGWRVSWGNVAGRVSVDGRALERDYPEVYQAVAKRGAGHRAFRVMPPKGG